MKVLWLGLSPDETWVVGVLDLDLSGIKSPLGFVEDQDVLWWINPASMNIA